MSTPEARLSAAERAALADLESAAAAADPHFAARLRGRAPSNALPFLVSAHAVVLAGRQWAVERGWWSIPVTVMGLALVVAGLSYGFWVSLVGIVVTIAGLLVFAELADRRWVSPGRSPSSAPEA